MIFYFKDLHEHRIEEIGGKALNLGLMYNVGMRIPNGFVLSSKMYETYLLENNISQSIGVILLESTSSEIKAQKIQSLFKKESISTEMAGQILTVFDHIGYDNVAVRSSSNMEDLPGMSFAGQYTSYLNVTKEDLLDKVILCWRSLWNQRAIDYRRKFNIEGVITHCVIVQGMVDASESGVVFTANPITGNRDEMVINASYGLGEAIVGGHVTPDQFILEKDNGNLMSESIHTKEKQFHNGHEGNDLIDVPKEVRDIRSLNSKQLEDLHHEALKIEALFNCPQDIEFAFDTHKKLYILQTRAITTLFPTQAFDKDDKLRAYLGAGSVLLGMKEAFKPLGADLYGGMFPNVLDVMLNRKKPIPKDFVKYAGGRIYLDISYLLSNGFFAKQFAKVFSGNDLAFKATMEKLLEDHGKDFKKQGIRFKIPWGILIYSLNSLKVYKRARKVPVEKRYDRIKELGQELYTSLQKKAVHAKSLEEKWRFCEEAMLAVFKLTQEQAMYCVEVNNYAKIVKKINRWYPNRFNMDELTYHLPDCITVELGLALNRVAGILDNEGVLPSEEHPEIQKIIHKFGHRATVELDFGYQRWRDNPTYLIKQIEQYMVDEAYKKNLSDMAEKAQKAETLMEDIYSITLKKKGKRIAKKMRKDMLNYRIAAGMREYPKYNIVQVLDLCRTLILEEGTKLYKDGVLQSPSDIFYLRKEHIKENKIDLDLIQENKAVYRKEMKRNRVPRIVLNNGETYYSAQPIKRDSKVLQGLPLSSGIYEGRVRIVNDPNRSELKEGEILVTESTNPAWTPLFMTAGGLIMEYGGPLSHGGIVAREYGIPAVVGIASVSSNLRNGQLVRINGETGTVEILE